MKATFRALEGRDFRLFFFGQVISLMGTFIQEVALAWITYRVTGSAFYLALVAFSGQIPMLVAMPLGGMLADRFPKRFIMVCTHTVEMLLAFTMSYLTWKHAVDIKVLVLGSLTLGLSGAMEMPSRAALIAEIVHDRSVMTNAIALNSLSFNLARVTGPALAGIVLSLTTDSACFALNAISYLFAIAALLMLHPKKAVHKKVKGTLREAFAFVRDFVPARWLIFNVAIASFTTAPFMTFLPVFAKDVFHGGPDMLGTLMGTAGLGALSAALFLASRKNVKNVVPRLLIATFSTGFAGLLFSHNHLLTLALPLILVSGAAFIINVTSSNMMLQSLVDEHLRGRVMALYTMSVVGMTPLASLSYGFIVRHFGIQTVFMTSGAIAILFGLALRRQIPRMNALAHSALSEKGLI
jgi:MFS family permease